MNNISYWLFVFTVLVISNPSYSQSLSNTNYIPSEFKGDTCTETVYGISLEGNLLNTPILQSAMVYLPPNYDKLWSNYYTVLYLLPGYGGDHDDYYRLSQLLERLDELITGLKMKPMIVVTPNSKNAYLGSYFSNSYVTGNWEDFIADDLPHHIDSVYRVISNKNARGLSGFSMGGYGTLKIGMKHPAVFGTIGSLTAGPADFNEFFSNYLKPYLIKAAIDNDFSKANDWQTQLCFAMAAAFAPDSTEVPSLCRFPFSTEGERIDSIWQQWLAHDPLSMISTYKDSLLSLNSILMYIGSTDEFFYTGNNTFHQTLLENDITHTYREFDGGHVLNPIFNDVLLYFSDNLENRIPTIMSYSENSLEGHDSVCVKSDMDGTVFIIPFDGTNNFENIVNDHVISSVTFADSLLKIPVMGLDNNKYQVFAMSQDSSISNIPVEFYVEGVDITEHSIPDFALFPNPAQEKITLKINNQDAYEVVICTLNGNGIYSGRFNIPFCEIDLSSFQKGVYLITIRSEDFVTTRKIIKH